LNSFLKIDIMELRRNIMQALLVLFLLLFLILLDTSIVLYGYRLYGRRINRCYWNAHL
jgi:hypothetical protein